MTPDTSNGIENDDTVVLEEITTEGTGSGLEVERQSDDVSDITAPFDPKKIDVITQQRTVDLLMSRLNHGELDLAPDFQRRANLWDTVRKSSLIESMLLRIPIPSLYISEDKDGNYQVVDGLQRFCAIAHFVDVSYLNKSLNIKFNPLRLNGLQSLQKDLNDKSYLELPRHLQRRIMETELTVHVIRAGTPLNVKFNIFSRINQGGLPLKAQEIRNAIYPGKWREYIRKMAKDKTFLSATENRIKGQRLEDHELVLRFVALSSLPIDENRNAKENLDDFLNEFVEKRSVSWDDEQWQEYEKTFQSAVNATLSVFGRMAFRKYNAPGEARKPINRGLFETETVALARRSDSDINILTERSQQVIDMFGDKFDKDDEFTKALLYATGRGRSSNKRLEVINTIFDEVLRA